MQTLPILDDLAATLPHPDAHHRMLEWSGVVTIDEVYDAIGQFPEGLTSKQIADFLGKSTNQVSGLASKLFYYGKVDRDFAPGYRGIYRYKLKQR
jgi:hypothetical protein